MHAAQPWGRDDLAVSSRGRPPARRVFGQTQMSSVLVVIPNVVPKQSPQVFLVESNDVIQQVSAATLHCPPQKFWTASNPTRIAMRIKGLSFSVGVWHPAALCESFLSYAKMLSAHQSTAEKVRLMQEWPSRILSDPSYLRLAIKSMALREHTGGAGRRGEHRVICAAPFSESTLRFDPVGIRGAIR